MPSRSVSLLLLPLCVYLMLIYDGRKITLTHFYNIQLRKYLEKMGVVTRTGCMIRNSMKCYQGYLWLVRLGEILRYKPQKGLFPKGLQLTKETLQATSRLILSTLNDNSSFKDMAQLGNYEGNERIYSHKRRRNPETRQYLGRIKSRDFGQEARVIYVQR